MYGQFINDADNLKNSTVCIVPWNEIKNLNELKIPQARFRQSWALLVSVVLRIFSIEEKIAFNCPDSIGYLYGNFGLEAPKLTLIWPWGGSILALI